MYQVSASSRQFRFALWLGFLALTACGGGGGSAPAPRTLQSLAITPVAPSVALGLSTQLTATATYSDNTTENLTASVQWSSATQSVATVDAQGKVSPVSPGSTVIRAASGSVFATMTLQVTPAVLQAIAISPDPATTGVGIALQFRIAGSFSDGSSKPVTTGVVWSSAETASATIDAASGRATGVATGSATITATVGTLTASDSLSVVAHTWVPTGSLITPRRQHSATLLADGTILVAGGIGGSGGSFSDLTSTEVYDPVSRTWSARGSLPIGTAGQSLTRLADGRVLLVGQPGPEIYDPLAGTWSAAGSMNIVRTGHTATLLANGTVLVAGGYTGLAVSEASAEIFDPTALTWVLTGSLHTPRDGHTATLLPNGTVLIAGGETGCVTAGCTTVGATTEIYDPVAGTFSLTGSMSTNRIDHCATLLENGTVLLVGGSGTAGGLPGQTLATAEIYDPMAGTWTLTGSLIAARYDHSTTLLANGSVLAAGGVGVNNVATASAEFYDPIAGTWSAAPALNTARQLFTLSLLPNGTVLAAGGIDASPQTSSSAEIYYP